MRRNTPPRAGLPVGWLGRGQRFVKFVRVNIGFLTAKGTSTMRARMLFLLGLIAWSPALAEPAAAPWRGVDLSYVRELETCGATYRAGRRAGDPYRILSKAGANIVRLRLWHSPAWTNFSTLEDVEQSIARAKGAGMQVLLDFHYSDDWAHPGKQLIPAAWEGVTEPQDLAGLVYAYTYDVLVGLHEKGLAPDFVQLGNETNTDMLWPVEVDPATPINWVRNVQLLNAAIAGVEAAGRMTGHRPGTLLHISQPENVATFMDGGLAAGLLPVDMIGVSYYPEWSTTPWPELGDALAKITQRYGKEVVIVEAGYPWRLEDQDEAENLLSKAGLVADYPATVEGQRDFLLDLQRTVADAGGRGVIYWEPAWVTSGCKTRWGEGSHWDNATLFDDDGKLHEGAAFLGTNKKGR